MLTPPTNCVGTTTKRCRRRFPEGLVITKGGLQSGSYFHSYYVDTYWYQRGLAGSGLADDAYVRPACADQ